MTEEFNLSEKVKIGVISHTNQAQYGLLLEQDVKEFIKRLKAEFNKAQGEYENAEEIIDKLAGRSLI